MGVSLARILTFDLYHPHSSPPIPILTSTPPSQLSLRLTMSPRSSSSASLQSSPSKCPGAPDLRALACPVFPPFELYMDDSVEIPSMSEGTSAETSLDLPSPTPGSTSRVLQVLTDSLKRPFPQRGRAYTQTAKRYDWIHLVKQGGATPEDIPHADLPSDNNELRLFLDDLIPGSSSSLVSQDSAAFDDAMDDLPPPCLLNAFSSLSKHAHRSSSSRSRSHSRNPFDREGTPTEPETPKDDDVFFHHDSQTSSRTSLSEGMVSCSPLAASACSHRLAPSQDTNEQEVCLM